MPKHPSNQQPATSAVLPRPLVWAVTVCLIALAAVAVIAVSVLAGFTPEDMITMVDKIIENVSMTES